MFVARQSPTPRIQTSDPDTKIATNHLVFEYQVLMPHAQILEAKILNLNKQLRNPCILNPRTSSENISLSTFRV